MDRREFLKVLGLGGVALTLPKPLSILAEVERPPLHVGRLVFPNLAEDVTRFEMAGLSLEPERGLPTKRRSEFLHKWALRVVLRRPGEDIDMLRCPSWSVGPDFPAKPEGRYTLGHLWRFNPGERLECWLKPGEMPRYGLPRVRMALHGQLWRKGHECPLMYARIGEFETLRMDRDEAARLGICPAGEPEDDFSTDRQEEFA